MLCAQDAAARSEAELDNVLPQLRTGIRDHRNYVRAIAVEGIPEAFGDENKSARRAR
jgi:hypothetical protein